MGYSGENVKDVVIIPTYNEKENIVKIITQVTVLQPQLDVWIVDDNSPDGTASIVTKLASHNPRIKLFNRAEKNGLGSAYKYIHSKIQNNQSIRNVITMDADGSHNPENIKDLIDALSQYDLAVGSRYVKGGRIIGWGLTRFFLSYFGNIYSRIVTGFPIKDGTAGFVAFKRKLIDKIDFSKISGSGYAYQIEFKNALLKQGGKYCEIPITFVDRQIGKSKMSGHIVAEGLLMPWRILAKDNDAIRSRLYLLAVLGMIIFGVFFSLYKLSESPSVWYDEGIYYQMSANLTNHGVNGLTVAPGVIEHFSKITVGYPLIYPVAAFLAFFGTNILVGRTMMVIFIFAVIVVAYILIRKSLGKNEALYSLALLVSFAPLYGNGKSVLGEVPGMLYLLLSLLFIYLARIRVDHNSPVYYLALSGLFAGLSVATKPIFIVFICALVLAFLFKRKDILCFGKKIIYLLIFFVISFALWLFTQFQSGDSLAQILSFYANPQNVSSLSSTILTNISMFFTQIGPMYLLVILVIWSLSILVRVREKKIGLEEITSLIFSLLVTLAFLRTSGYLRYLFPAQILSIIYFPSSLFHCMEFIRAKTRNRFMSRKIVSLKSAVVLIAVLFLFGTYQLVFNSWAADSYGSHKTEFWEAYFVALPKDKKIFFYDTPEVAMFMKSGNYYQYLDLSPAGLLVGKNNDFLIDNGGVDKVVLKSNIFQENRDIWEKNYRFEWEVFKYTILVKK